MAYIYDTIAFVTIPVVISKEYDHMPTWKEVKADTEEELLSYRTTSRLAKNAYVYDYDIWEYTIESDLMDDGTGTVTEARFADDNGKSKGE